jgi:hypothetical protein
VGDHEERCLVGHYSIATAGGKVPGRTDPENRFALQYSNSLHTRNKQALGKGCRSIAPHVFNTFLCIIKYLSI